MHGLSLGGSKLLKERGIAFLGDRSRGSSSMVNYNGYTRRFSSIHKKFLIIISTLLHKTETTSTGYGLQVDVLKRFIGGRM